MNKWRDTLVKGGGVRILVGLCVLLGVGISVVNSKAVTKINCFETASLPDQITIFPPGKDIPEEVAGFSGLWSDGEWNDKLCNTLAITTIDAAGKVKGIYSWGISINWGVTKPGYMKFKGQISDGKLKIINFRNDADVSYWISGKNLKGRYFRKNAYYITLSKIR